MLRTILLSHLSPTFDTVNKYGRYLIFIVVAVLMVWYKLQYHELWKDEWQAYLVARDMDWGGMFSFLNYEGHPALWYIWLKLGAACSNSFYPQEESLISLLHSIPLVASIYLVTISIKSNWVVKIGVLLSYFFCFEYGIVNRGYILVILGGLLLVWLIQLKKQHGLWYAIVLLLICQAEVYGVMIGGVLLLYSILQDQDNLTLANRLKKQALPIGLFSLGVLVFIVTVWPRGAEDDFTRAYQQSSFNVDVLFTAIQGNLANTFAIGLVKDTSANSYSTGGLISSILSLVLSILLFIKNRQLLISWLVLVTGFFLFSILIFAGGVRQWGMLYMGFCLLVFLLDIDLTDFARIVPAVILMLPPVIYTFRAISLDHKHPYSNAQLAGDFIKETIPAGVPIVSLNKFETAAAAAYADRNFYELPTGEPFSYFKWLEQVYVPTQSELMLFAEYKKVAGLVLISPSPIDQNRFSEARLWKKIDTYNIKREDFYIYSLAK